ncbi:ARF guanine-nucleotide exchange factor GNOM-like protein, partial [Tanacetum coccineum]
MNLDIALRVFLETFRLPGESQKIERVVEAFSERYYEQSPHILVNKDAALVLSYSLIMLNTDQHNAQVKKKMTEEDFIRNNRLINGGNDLPREYLSELFHSICENEIQMTPEQGVMTHDNWAGLIHKSRQTAPYIICGSGDRINNEMFAILSGPTVAALSVVLDLVEQEDVLQTCIDGFLDVAKIAGCYHLGDVLDGLLVSLSKFTTLSVEESVFAFGDDTKAGKATIAVFTIAHLYGDYIRSGWRNILDCISSLRKLGLLPTRLARDAADDLEPNSEPDSRVSPLVEARKRATETVKDCNIESVSPKSTDGLSCFKMSRMNLVDLAGSERQTSTGAAGQRLKEAGKQRHIPYRHSKLTFLLPVSLGGNAKLSMICAISPAQSCKSETISTIRFAQRAKAIKNKAVVNEQMQNDVNTLREVIKQLKDELIRIKSTGNQFDPSVGYSTGWNARRSINVLKYSLHHPLILPHVDDDGDEEMEIVDETEQVNVPSNKDNKSTTPIERKDSTDSDITMEEVVSEQAGNIEVAGHARMLEQYADLEEKHINLLTSQRRMEDGILDVKKAAAKAGVK